MLVISSLVFLLVLGHTDLSPQLSQHYDYECQYLSVHKELVCQCTRYHLDITSVATVTRGAGGHVESVKLEQCQSVNIGMDMVEIVQPFYQIRLENIDRMRIHDVKLGHADNLDIVVRNVRDMVHVSGEVTCTDCGDHDGDNGDVRETARPTLILQVKDVASTQMEYLDISNVNTRISLRNIETVSIDSSIIDTITENAIEAWYVKTLSMKNTIINNASDKGITINHVDAVNLFHTLGIKNTTLNIMSKNTSLITQCTAVFSSYDTRDIRVYNWNKSECGSVSEAQDKFQSTFHDQLSSAGRTRTGTIVTIVLCALLVVSVIILLIILNRKGKLDRLL